MRLSEKTREELYSAIRVEIIDARIKLKLPAKEDVILAQVETAIWKNIKKALKIDCL